MSFHRVPWQISCFDTVRTSAEQGQRSNRARPLLRSGKGLLFPDLCLRKAATWRENVEGAGEGAEAISTRVFHRV
jgi:hypothetical protein